jgi:hypothetical protein
LRGSPFDALRLVSALLLEQGLNIAHATPAFRHTAQMAKNVARPVGRSAARFDALPHIAV